jgi:AcrR family transcriptional regulator
VSVVPAQIVAEARQLFAGGVADVRMSDVARAAGISRAYLYRLVPGREALIELALVARCEEFGDDLEARARRATGDIADEIVDQAMHGITLAVSDAEFGRLADALPRTRLAHLLTSTQSPIHSVLVRTFGPLLDRALQEGRLRTDVPVERIYTWLQSVHGHMASRDDLDDAERRAMLRDFLLPAVLVG